MDISEKLKLQFPLSAKYGREWVRQHSLGENVLYNMEALTRNMRLEPGMRVLDLACGTGVSSIFLAREYGVEVWAVDAHEDVSSNFDLIKEMNCEDSVFPLKADARKLPFADGFFDAVTVVDSITYFGTDDKYLPYLSAMVKPGGQIGIMDIAIGKEIDTFEAVPEWLMDDYTLYWYYVHSLEWWKRLWQKTGLVNIAHAQKVSCSDLIRAAYIQDSKKKDGYDPFAKALEKDSEGFLSFFCLVGERTERKSVLDRYS